MPLCRLSRYAEGLRLGAAADVRHSTHGLGQNSGHCHRPESADWCRFSRFQYRAVRVRSKENLTTGQRHNGLALLLWELAQEKLLQGAASKSEKAHVSTQLFKKCKKDIKMR